MDNIRDPDYEITNIAKEQLRIREETGKFEVIFYYTCYRRYRSTIYFYYLLEN